MKIPGRVRRRRAKQTGEAAASATPVVSPRPAGAGPAGARPPAGTPDGSAPGAEVMTQEALTEEVARLAGELAEAGEVSPSRWQRFRAAATRLVRRSGQAGRAGGARVGSGGRWLTAQVLAMAPRLPVRNQATLRAQFPGLTPEELADKLITGSSRAAASVGAAVGAAMFLPLPAAPVEILVETLAVVGIEVKLVAELHEVYSMRAPGPVPERMLAAT